MALAVAMFPVVSIVGPLFDMWRTVGLYDTWPGLVIPYLSFTLPALHLDPHRLLPPAPVGARGGGADGRRDALAGVPQGDRAARRAGGVATAAILTFLFGWNDFVFGISLTSTDRARNVPAALAFFTGASQFQHPRPPRSPRRRWS